MITLQFNNVVISWKRPEPLDRIDVLWKRFTAENPRLSAFSDPVFGIGDEWYFWDEVWVEVCGPFPSRQWAEESCINYSDSL